MGAFAKPELKLRVRFEKGSGDMAEKHDIPSHVHVELVLLALERAMSGIRFIEENDICISEFRKRLPAVMNELNKATFFLRELKAPSTSTPIFLSN